MRLIVGLGNPGERYKNTRHNVGFIVLDKLVQELGFEGWELSKKNQSLIINNQPLYIYAKPQTFMNESGRAVSKLSTYYKLQPTDLHVIHDDLDIKLGEYKIQYGKGPKVHGGLNSIEEKLGTKEFWRVRIGIENRFQKALNPKIVIRNESFNSNDKNSKLNTEHKIPDTKLISGEDYVLQKFTKEELSIVYKVVDNAAKDLAELGR
jgi:peptidyl-tRNA hydrolase, PTH1 family